MLLSHEIIIKSYMVYKRLDIFLYFFIIMFIYHHQVHLNFSKFI